MTCLVTSRARLMEEDERAYELRPLPVPSAVADAPEGLEEAQGFAGVRLFETRAREADPSFALVEDNAKEVVRIVAELNGIPLAIELAAARARILDPRQIASKLGQKFQLLRSTRLDVTIRQRTLEGAIDWSYELLEDWENSAFLQACYFRDGLTLAAAEEVIDLSAFEGAPTGVDIARSLRDKSLLTAADAGPEIRLGMYRAIRDYGFARWREAVDEAEREGLARRHAGYYLDFVEEWNRLVSGHRDQEAFDRIDQEIGNLGAVREWALRRADAKAAGRAALGVAETMKVRRPPRQLLPWLKVALDVLGEAESPLRVRLLTQLSGTALTCGEWDRAVADAAAAVGGARSLTDDAILARALAEQGEVLRNRGDLDGALAAFSEGEEAATRGGDVYVRAVCTGGRGMVLGQKGDFDAAFRCFCEAESLARQKADHRTVALHMHNRGVVYERRAELDAALDSYREAEDLSRQLGNRVRVAVELATRGNVIVQSGRPDLALSCYREGEEIARELGARQRIAQIVKYRGGMHVMIGEYAEALRCYEEAESIARELNEPRRLATTLFKRGRVYEHQVELESALECYAEAEKIGRELGDRWVVAEALCNRGGLLKEQDRTEEAWEALEEGVRTFEEMHADRSVWAFGPKASLAEVAERRGDVETARRLAEECLLLARSLRLTSDHPERVIRDSLENLGKILGL